MVTAMCLVLVLFLNIACGSLLSNVSFPLVSSRHISLLAAPEVVCTVVAENAAGSLTCPTGYYITNLVFASYGTATGTCPNFALGSCNSAQSSSVMTTACVGKTSCSFTPTNTLFVTDPCQNTLKTLTVAVNCGNPTSQPSRQPTSQPSRQPSGQPTRQPTSQPSRSPSAQPSGQPTRQPIALPSVRPTAQPSRVPTIQPSVQPSTSPTSQPSSEPTNQPSTQPTSSPSDQPSGSPCAQPTDQPSIVPTCQPSVSPSVQPSLQPSGVPTMQPSKQPTSSPSHQPSVSPTSQPSSWPSAQPSSQPTGLPTIQPTAEPSRQPSSSPTSQPSLQPTSRPSSSPSDQPSVQPTRQPTLQPATGPSLQPSSHPSAQPSVQPSVSPTGQPSKCPSRQPTLQPSGIPTRQPTSLPSSQPSGLPSSQPSVQPLTRPSSQPSTVPTRQPSRQPSCQPSMHPSLQPSNRPTFVPTAQPTTSPSSQPSARPTHQPTTQPSRQPTLQPLGVPSAPPSGQPTVQPSERPSNKPSSHPTSQPSTRPSFQPSAQPTNLPTRQPASHPSSRPSVQPSTHPSSQPFGRPSAQPSSQPFSKPSKQPSSQPTGKPSSLPSDQPSMQPVSVPSSLPSKQPWSLPTATPLMQPSSMPSNQPNSHPSSLPSRCPSNSPSKRPSSIPYSVPSRQPVSTPTARPSGQPTSRPSGQPFSLPTSLPSRQPASRPSSQPFSRPSAQPSRRPTSQPSKQPFALPSSQPTSSPSISNRPTSFQEQSKFFQLISVTGLSSDASVKIVLPYNPTSSKSDGYFDVNISAVPSDGETFVVYSNKSRGSVPLPLMQIAQGFSVMPSVSYDFSSRSVSSLGDVNGDGYNDLIIGVPYKSRCYVMFGTAEGYANMSLGFMIHGASAVDLTGWSVSSAGDVNNDTIADILIGAPRGSNGLMRSGVVYVVFGSRLPFSDVYLDSLSPSQGFVILGDLIEDGVGLSVSDAGDINGDGFDDIVIGSLKTSALYAGGAFIVYGSSNATRTAVQVSSMISSTGVRLLGDAWSRSGFAVSGAGDVNNDGYDDILIGSVPQKGSALTSQTTYLLYGGPSLSTDVVLSSLRWDQAAVYVGAGSLLGRVRDINKDRADLLMATGLSTAAGVGYVILHSLFVNAPTPMPSVAPSISPTTFVPTLKPFRSRGPSRLPTVSQTLPSEMPTSRPSISGMSESEGTDFPTSFPSVGPTEATDPPTSKPSGHPSSVPTAHTGSPTLAPTAQPTARPTTAAPTQTPSLVPRVITRPTVLPTFTVTYHLNQTTNVMLVSGGAVNRTTYAYRGRYTWNVAADVRLLGHGTVLGDVFIIMPNTRCTLSIEYFNQSLDLIDLTAYPDYHRYQQLNVTEGSVRINLPDMQTIHILNLHPGDLSDRNFLFALEPVPSQAPTLRYQIIVVLSVCSVMFLGLIWLSVRYYHRYLKWKELKRVSDGIIERQKPLVTHSHSVYKNSLVGKTGDDVESEESLYLHNTNENSVIGSSELSSMEMGGEGLDDFTTVVEADANYEQEFIFYQQKINRDMLLNGSDSSGGEEEKCVSDRSRRGSRRQSRRSSRRSSRHSDSPPDSFVISDDYNSDGFV